MSYQIGQIVEGKVTGIQSYGAFVSLDPKTSGLIHISEISDGFVRDVGLFVHVGILSGSRSSIMMKKNTKQNSR